MLYITMNCGSDIIVNPNETLNQFVVSGTTNLSERSIAHKDVMNITLTGSTYKRLLDMCPNIPRVNQGSVKYRGDTAVFVLDNWDRIMNFPKWDGEYENFDLGLQT